MDPVMLERQRNALKSEGWDALISLSPENFAYTTGFPVPSQSLMRWRHAIAVVTDANLDLVVVDMEETTVRDHVPGARIRGWNEFTGDPMQLLGDLLEDLGLANGTVGVELDYLPAADYDRLRKRLPRCRLVADQDVLARLRQVKTTGEIALLRRLSALTDRAIYEALGIAKPGVTELELAARLTQGLFTGGAEYFKLMIIASGERSQYPNVGPTARALKPGDLIRMEVFGIQRGYHAGVCRTAVVGRETEEQARIWATLDACKKIVLDGLRPGASAAELYRRFLAKFGELGLAPISFVGHGIGLHLHEEPYLGKYGDARLEAGMVLGIEPLVYIPGRFGLQNKMMVLVGEDGADLLSNVTPDDTILRVG